MKLLPAFVGMALLCLSSTLSAQAPLDDIVSRRIVKERPLLKYPPIREADIFWEKRISRLIDTRQKQNLPFMYPPAPFFEILKQGVESGKLNIYAESNFETELNNMDGIFYEIDTIITLSDDYVENITVVRNEVGYEQIQKYRLQEIWYFDEATSTMRVQILGIAPIKTRTDELGNALYDQPMFWIHFPSSRSFLASQQVASDFNDVAMISWDDLFQMRQFASHITKQSNVRDNRLQDIYSGVELLQEAEKIKQEIQNFEHDLWSY